VPPAVAAVPDKKGIPGHFLGSLSVISPGFGLRLHESRTLLT
jgi:hypothetical protein